MRSWLVIFLMIGAISAVSVSCDLETGNQGRDTYEYTYECACDCQSPIGNILNRFNVCATSETDAMSKTDEMMRKRGCDFSVYCYSCDQRGVCE